MTDTPLSTQIRDIAWQVRRLRHDYKNPERYFEDKDEIEHDLKRIARRLETEDG